MSLLLPILFLLTILIFPLITVHASTGYCNRSCGSNNVNYPFGFSAGCQIHLNCSSNGQMLIGEFPVQSVNTDNMKTIIEPKCNRSVQTLHQLYGKNFAPTGRNAILLYDCDSSPTTCKIPSTNVQTQYQSLKCDSNSSKVISNISCYSERPENFLFGFLSYKNVTGQHCRYLMSSISVEAFDSSGASLDVQVVELRWWIEGSCQCSKDANCDDKFVSPHGQPVFRCRCKDGFEGDGYSAGSGCRKAATLSVMMVKKNLVIGIATTVGGIMIICIIICIYKWRKNSSIITTVMFWKKTKNDRDLEAFIRNYGSLAPKRYSFSNVKKMTNSFKDKLGQGGFGGVYKGKLPDGQLVAVKLMNTSKGNGHDFINEVASMSRTSHVNVVKIVGFCLEGSKRALMYEFMPNGSLEKFIHGKDTLKTNQHLGWEKLYQIALGIAKGLEYLHRGCNTRILHFDIKPHNILLDEGFCPKISDFGLAKLCPKNESIVSMLEARGTIGYIAPEVFNRNFGEVSHKSDVYSYGMMVLEMVGGRKNLHLGVDNSSEIYFPKWIHKHMELGEEIRLSDAMTSEEKDMAKKMIFVGLWCIQTIPLDRPSMNKVIDMLQGSIETLKIPPNPFHSTSSSQTLIDSAVVSMSQ